MKHAILYARFSARPGAALCESNEAQLESMRAFCISKGITVAGEFQDRAASGADDTRPGLWDAIRALKRGYILLADHPDRLARDLMLGEVIREKAEVRGATVETVNARTESTLEGEMVRKILAVISEYRRKADAALTSKRSRRHQATGRKMSKIAPFGYADDPKDATRIIPNPTEQAICARVCELAAKGLKSMRIKRTLEADKVMCRGKSEWNRRTIQRIITRGIA